MICFWFGFIIGLFVAGFFFSFFWHKDIKDKNKNMKKEKVRE